MKERCCSYEERICSHEEKEGDEAISRDYVQSHAVLTNDILSTLLLDFVMCSASMLDLEPYWPSSRLV